jgi:hypothetical protein
MYAEAIQDAIRGMGHSCKLVFAYCRDVICQLRITVLFEEQKRRELNNEPALERGLDSEKFVEDFLIEHEVALTAQLGMEDGPPMRFLTGIFIATSTSKSQVLFLQDVVQADAAHMTLGKYTLFSAYVNTANEDESCQEFSESVERTPHDIYHACAAWDKEEALFFWSQGGLGTSILS